MGCPKHAAVNGGMGLALLRSPERAEDILKSLRRTLPAHVHLSCKIRLLEDARQTLEVCRRLAAAGAEAITVHTRQGDQSASSPPVWSELASVALGLSPIPVLVNGSVWSHAHAAAARKAAGVPGVMVGRGSLRDMSLFGAAEAGQGLTAQVQEYGGLAVQFENPALNTRFVLQWMFHEQGKLLTDLRAARLQEATTLEQIADAIEIQEFFGSARRGAPLPATHYYADSKEYFSSIGAAYFAEPREEQQPKKSNADFRAMLLQRRAAQELPTKRKKKKKELINHKQQLAEHLKAQRKAAPRYELLQECAPEEKAMGYFAAAYKMKVCVEGREYHSDKFAKSKDRAGHRAACVALEAILEPKLELKQLVEVAVERSPEVKE